MEEVNISKNRRCLCVKSKQKYHYKLIINILIMELDDFIQNFAEQFDETDASVFTPETVFHELEEYSSLIALSIIAMIDEELGVTIGANEMRSSVTIKDLYDQVMAKV
jgi:acyl carrier protein